MTNSKPADSNIPQVQQLHATCNMDQVVEADLCIVGAGYAGVNALNAAAHHLAPGSRVVVIAKERDWGGHVSIRGPLQCHKWPHLCMVMAHMQLATTPLIRLTCLPSRTQTLFLTFVRPWQTR